MAVALSRNQALMLVTALVVKFELFEKTAAREVNKTDVAMFSKF